MILVLLFCYRVLLHTGLLQFWVVCGLVSSRSVNTCAIRVLVYIVVCFTMGFTYIGVFCNVVAVSGWYLFCDMPYLCKW